MFWKRKRNKPEPELEVAADDQREHYRVRLPAEMPARVRLREGEFQIRDLSAGGIAFAGPAYAVGNRLAAVLLLGPQRLAVKAVITIVDADVDGISHASLGGLEAADRAALHRFVLEVQKHEIRNTRERRAIGDDDL